MNKFLTSTCVALCGLATSILTAITVVAVANSTGFNLFTLSFWMILPVGALLVGLASASGYYFGSLLFHKKPDLTLLLQMVLIAAFTQILIYYMEYSTLVLEDGTNATDVVTFFQYLDLSFTKAHYSFGRAAQHDMGEAGNFGYWMAIFQFFGFMFGGVAIFGLLSDRPLCTVCEKYLRTLASKTKSFETTDEFAPYYDGLFEHPIDSPEFASMIQTKFKAKKIDKGAVTLSEALCACPKCKAQTISHKVQIHSGNDWKDISELNRLIALPEGANVKEAFKA